MMLKQIIIKLYIKKNQNKTNKYFKKQNKTNRLFHYSTGGLATINHQVSASAVRTLIRGKEESSVGDLASVSNAPHHHIFCFQLFPVLVAVCLSNWG
jgi:hypothetical protein